jgi:hypothetical protein
LAKRRSQGSFNELYIHQFVQVAISFIEYEDDMPTVRAILSQLRNSMRDVEFHGSDKVGYAYGTWADSQCIAYKQCSALIARRPQFCESTANH